MTDVDGIVMSTRAYLMRKKGDTVEVPPLTPEQRLAALDKAAETRRRRAELLQQLKSGQLHLSEVLAQRDDPVIARTRASVLLRALPGIGEAKAARAMADIGIAPSRRVRGLGVHQTAALIALFG
ncbi:integration host factor, actinobacterial type [Actinotignum sanguinis]|uniref:integration host factor, actinobacterial type n=3 Tax=Actinomycetales TaxID=2037 RepID=UPI003D6FDAAE